MDYIKRKSNGTHVVKQQITEKIIEREPSQSPINMEDLANAIAKAMSKNVIVQQAGAVTASIADTFDSSKTMEKMGEAMTIQKGNNEANFDNLGQEKKTKRSKESTNKTIDLLKNLGD